uniref:C-type lectin n=1 Tax=Acrobeloides nanus TaxID=290746 RepID=A0A914DSD0_9BILA
MFKIKYLLTFVFILGAYGQDCPKGWSYYDNKCWSVQDTSLDWADAEKACEAQGGTCTLASIESAMEQWFVQDIIKKFGSCQYFWLGGHASGNGYTWTNGNPFNYSHWGPTDPNPAYTCVGLKTPYYNWHTLNCNYKDCSVCSKPYTGGTGGFSCSDADPTNCPRAPGMGSCTGTASWFWQLNCPKSCGLCTTGQNYGSCVDINQADCAQMMSQTSCRDNSASWYKKVCPKTCGSC